MIINSKIIVVFFFFSSSNFVPIITCNNIPPPTPQRPTQVISIHPSLSYFSTLNPFLLLFQWFLSVYFWEWNFNLDCTLIGEKRSEVDLEFWKTDATVHRESFAPVLLSAPFRPHCQQANLRLGELSQTISL